MLISGVQKITVPEKLLKTVPEKSKRKLLRFKPFAK